MVKGGSAPVASVDTRRSTLTSWGTFPWRPRRFAANVSHNTQTGGKDGFWRGDVLPVTCAGAATLLDLDAVPPPAVRRLTMFWGLSPPYPSSGEAMVVLRGTESLLTHPWREMDSNYWSRQGETPLGRHVVSAHGSTSVTSPRQQPASDRRYLQPATISHLAIVLRTFRSFGPGTRSTGISRC